MAQTKKDLQKAKNESYNEFYTQMFDIANELNHYKPYFKGKRIISPCDWDAPYTCNFINFLRQVQTPWGIKSIHYSGYNPKTKEGIKFQDVDYNDYDIVVTNPPFSHWREFIDTLMRYPHLKFVVVGPQLAITYKEIFKLLFAQKLWLGYTHLTELILEDGTSTKRTKKSQLPSTCKWYTNLPNDTHHGWRIMTDSYYQNPSRYQKADNMDVLYIPRVVNIPYDYAEPMAVPIGFMLQWNPEQFELISLSRYYVFGYAKTCDLVLKGKKKFMKLIIRNKFPVEKAEDQYDTSQRQMTD